MGMNVIFDGLGSPAKEVADLMRQLVERVGRLSSWGQAAENLTKKP